MFGQMKMRLTAIFMLCCCLITLISCQKKDDRELLAYQNDGLYIDAIFTIDDDSFEAKVELEPPQYDESGRMLARRAKLTLGGNSIISGVSFEFEGGTAYVVSGVLKIPVEDEELISGITDILSLFCISPDSFYESDAATYGGESCTRAIYAEGASTEAGGNRVTVYIADSSGLPLQIEAALGEKSITAQINEIRAEKE